MNNLLKEKFLAFHEANKNIFESRRAFDAFSCESGLCPQTCHNTYDHREVHIYTGIAPLAKALGMPLERRPHSEEYPWRYFFTHEGWKYFQINQDDETLETAEAAPAPTGTASNE